METHEKANRKTNRTFKLIALSLVAVLAVAAIISGTMAKYTDTRSGSSSARVARFEVGMGNDNEVFNLFDTVLNEDGTDEDHVAKASAGEDAIIAPGTSGKFSVELYNSSEVDVEYLLELTVDNPAKIPLQFRVAGGSWTDYTDPLESDGTLPMLGTTPGMVDVEWRWPFGDEAQDLVDTPLGLDGTATVEVTADVTFTQIN